MKRRLMAVLMALVMTLSLLPVSAFAADAEPPVKTGYYGADGNWVEGELHQTLPAGVTKVDKTAVKTGDNTYEVTLTVQLEQTTETTLPGAAATVLVVDTSGSMGYCAECGNEKGHSSKCKYYRQGLFVDNSVKAEQTRMAAAKTAAENFLKSYSGRYDKDGKEVAEQELNLGRYVSVVAFESGAEVKSDWKDVSSKMGYTAVLNAINGLWANGGTNLEQGLAKANDQFNKELVRTIAAKNAIALTDGVPTFYGANEIRQHGDRGCPDTNAATMSAATTLKEHAELYTVCFGAAGTKCWTKGSTHREGGMFGYGREEHKDDGPTVDAFLRDSIATKAEGKTYAYNADNADELNQAFAAITSSITTGLSSGLVKDSLPEGGVSADERFASEWELKGVEGVKVGNKTIYTYTKTYTVTVDPETATLDENGYTPLNGETTLTVGENETVDFPIPAVKAQITDEIVVTIKGNTDTAKYDGKSHSVTGYEVKSIARNGVSYDGYTENDFAFTGTATADGTNADSYPMGLEAGNFANINNRFAHVTFVVEDGGLEITKRVLTLTSATDSKEYDGTPLTNDTVTPSGDGFADGESASYNVTGSVTYVSEGEVENTFEVKLNDNTLASNYDIETVEGKLTITPKDVTFTGKSDSREWTGEEQEITGITPDGLLTGDTYEGLSYSAKGTDAGEYDGVFSGDVVIKDADGVNVTDNYNVIKTPGVLTITDKTEEVTVTFRIVNGAWEDGSRADKTATVTLTNGKGTLDEKEVPTGMQPDKGYTNGTWDVTPNTAENAIKGGEVYTYSYEKIIPASFSPNGYIVKQMTGDEMPAEETFTVNVAPAAGGAGVNGTATLRTGSTNFVFPENSSFAISEETIFMVSEDAGSAARVTYDDNVYQLKVTVKLNAAGTAMEVDKVYCSADGETWHEIDSADSDKLVITNSYEAEIIPDAITIDLSQYIQKELKLTGDNRFTGATYTASVTPIIDGELGEAKTISVSYAANESGLKTFNGTLTFTESGTYRYEVRENIPANATGYDTSVYELLVIVTAEDGKLVATVGQKLAGDQSGELTNEPIVFHNTYNTGNATIIIPPDERPTLNTDDHYAYVMGYPDGTVRPMGNITRAEVATIFFRLLTDDSRAQFWATTNAYSDVKSGDWFNNAVSTLSNAGIISGYPDGTFRPNAPITRAEMAKVVALFAKLDKSENLFNDIAGHWAEAYIRLAAGNGWIAGYPDGSFKPQQNITRAETMTMINRVLDRVPSVESHLLPYNVMLTFPDCQSGQWYYIAVQEATNSHTYERAVTEKHGDEQWIALRENRDWTEFEH